MKTTELFLISMHVWKLFFGQTSNPRYLLSLLLIFSFFSLRVYSSISTTKVIELSDRFLDVWKDGYWLVKFYAPWCGHCKKLEPVFSQVAQGLYGTSIKVGKVDCTRFTSVATEFGIKGFPTILFLKYGEIFTYKSERSLNEILSFAHKVSGPPVKHITNGEFLDILRSHIDEVVFVYVGDQEGTLWDSFSHVASKYHEHNFFYESSPGCFAEHTALKEVPGVAVFREGNFSLFTSASTTADEMVDYVSHVNGSLHKWVNEERFLLFSRVTHSTFHQMLTTNKYLVLVVLEENKIGDLTEDMEQFRDMIELIVGQCHTANPGKFQFGWIANPDLANSIAMEHLPVPSLLVVNSTTYQHHIPDDDPAHLTPEAILLFLEDILTGSATVYGGDTYSVRAYRMYFEAKSSLSDMWRDIMDAEDEDVHHKQE